MLVHLHFVARMFVVVSTVLTGMRVCMAFASAIVAVGVFMLVKVFVCVQVRVLVAVHQGSVAVFMRVHMRVLVGVKMTVFMISFHD